MSLPVDSYCIQCYLRRNAGVHGIKAVDESFDVTVSQIVGALVSQPLFALAHVNERTFHKHGVDKHIVLKLHCPLAPHVFRLHQFLCRSVFLSA